MVIKAHPSQVARARLPKWSRDWRGARRDLDGVSEEAPHRWTSLLGRWSWEEQRMLSRAAVVVWVGGNHPAPVGWARWDGLCHQGRWGGGAGFLPSGPAPFLLFPLPCCADCLRPFIRARGTLSTKHLPPCCGHIFLDCGACQH